jgi:PQQ-like domain
MLKMRPERRRRGDVIAAAGLALLLVVGVVVLWRLSPVANTTSRVATTPIAAPPPAAGAPAAFVEAWRVPSAATPAPVVAGPAVVTADGGTVAGRDARTGAEAWSYTRDRPLCTAGAGFPDLDGGLGRALALFQGPTGWCSELTPLRPDTGARSTARAERQRADARNPDARPGTRLLADRTHIATTGRDFIEVFRSDLVATAEYGAVPTPLQPGRQPRAGCTYGSTVLAARRIGVIERCAADPTDRLTVLSADGKEGADTPDITYSELLPAKGATIVAVSADRAAVALPNPARLVIFDKAGTQIAQAPLDVPDADLAADPSGGVPATESDRGRIYWWTGSRTIALSATDLTPLWTVQGALGPAVAYGQSVLVPVADGLLDVEPSNGTARRTIPVARADRAAPVRLAALGEMLLEQRGPEVVGLRPAAP